MESNSSPHTWMCPTFLQPAVNKFMPKSCTRFLDHQINYLSKFIQFRGLAKARVKINVTKSTICPGAIYKGEYSAFSQFSLHSESMPRRLLHVLIAPLPHTTSYALLHIFICESSKKWHHYLYYILWTALSSSTYCYLEHYLNRKNYFPNNTFCSAWSHHK